MVAYEALSFYELIFGDYGIYAISQDPTIVVVDDSILGSTSDSA